MISNPKEFIMYMALDLIFELGSKVFEFEYLCIKFRITWFRNLKN